ncbi:MAG: JAB domain-containing protein [Rectinemataceae bacterium]
MTYQIVSERSEPAYRISSPSDAYKAFSRYAKARTERFLVAVLNGAHEVNRVVIVSIGSLNRTVVTPSEVFFPCIRFAGVACLLGHNHPSGKLDPSPEDIEITRRLREGGELLGISVLDHLIVGPKGGFYSFIEHGLIVPSNLD